MHRCDEHTLQSFRLFSGSKIMLGVLGIPVRGFDPTYRKESGLKVKTFLMFIYTLIIAAILLANIVRLIIAARLSESPEWLLKNLGDVSSFYPRSRRYQLIVAITFGLHALFILFYFQSYSTNSLNVWLNSISEYVRLTSSKFTADFKEELFEEKKSMELIISMLIILLNCTATTVVNAILIKQKGELKLSTQILSWLIFNFVSTFVVSGLIIKSMNFFSLTSLLLRMRFGEIVKDLRRLTTQLTATKHSSSSHQQNQSHMITQSLTTLREKHYRMCEMVEDADDFWRIYIFITYCLHIPFTCYCIYEILINSIELSTTFLLAWYGLQSLALLCIISLSASSVSAEIHRPYLMLAYISQQTLSKKSRVQLGSFLQRLGGSSVGFHCLDFFVITTSKISSVSAAILSSFFIVIDFNRGDGEIKERFCKI